jgi:RING finger protein 121
VIGMQRRMAVSVRTCGICAEDLADFGVVVDAREEAAGSVTLGESKTVQLACKHCFHLHCIRGWTIVGKKVGPMSRPSSMQTQQRATK